ncbi:MAG: RluA family pseudouridine synthase [Chlamydiae bacterium]|nr:RluA family pseudouridine synthase [Chlamydiota bacterium]
MTLLIDILKERFPDMKRSSLLQLLSQERVSYEGFIITAPQRVITKPSQVDVGPRLQFLHKNVKILFSDNNLIVVEKPAGLLSVETDTSLRQSLHAVLKEEYHPHLIYVVHRLDRDVSGIMLYAKNQKAFASLKKQLTERSLKREYGALVSGLMQEESGTWESYLVEDLNLNVRSTNYGGELARTHYNVIRRGSKSTLLKIELDTGRKHQIRVHCKEAGHPLMGDKRYEGYEADRLMLHATKLTFIHPTTEKKMFFTRPLPESFNIWLGK